MKKLVALTLMVSMTTGFAVAQTTLDDFEAGAADWGNSAGYTTFAAVSTDGANGTSASVQFSDGGWGKDIEKTYTAVVPADGDYKVTFYYKNGHEGNPWPGLGVRINGANEVVLGSDVVTDWTASETQVAAGLTAGSDVTVQVYGSSSGTADCQCRIDEIMLVSASVPISADITPLTNQFIAGTTTITAVPDPAGGSGTFTQAAFDVGDDGSVEYTDTTPGDGFTYDLDTTALADGATDVKVTITDDAAATGDSTVSYTVANAEGRTAELVTNGGFETWAKQTLPTGWTQVDLDADGNVDTATQGVVSQNTTDPFEGSSSMTITYAVTPGDFRYTMMSNSFDGDRMNYVMQGAMRGSSLVRLCLFESNDGVAWISTWHLFNPGATTLWTYAADPAPYTPAANTTYMSVCTHFTGAGVGEWDVVSVTSSTEVGVQDWDLY